MLRPATWCVLFASWRRRLYPRVLTAEQFPSALLSLPQGLHSRSWQEKAGDVGTEDKHVEEKETETVHVQQSSLLGGLSSTLLDKLSADRGIDRASLQQRIETLLSVGCTMRQIHERLTILKLSPQTILRRTAILKEMSGSPVSVDLIFLAGRSTSKLKELLAAKDAVNRQLCAEFGCSMSKLQEWMEEHPALRQLKKVTPQEIHQKVAVLHQFGVTNEEIIQSAEILNVKGETIFARMHRLDRLRKEEKLSFQTWPIQTMAGKMKRFEYVVQKALNNSREIDGSVVSFEKIASRLRVSEKDLRDACISVNFPLSGAIERIDFLLEQGVSGQDILNHVHLLSYKLEQLQSVVEQCQKFSIPSSNIYVILSFLRSGHIPTKSTVFSRQKKYVAKLLGLNAATHAATGTAQGGLNPAVHAVTGTVHELNPAAHATGAVQSQHKGANLQHLQGDELRPVWSADRLTIKRNFDFLQSEGFGVEDIKSCVLLLAHHRRVLQEYYRSLWHRPELVGHAGNEVWTDKRRVLSALQYVIEKDMNFASTVFMADIEYGQRGAMKEEEKTQV